MWIKFTKLIVEGPVNIFIIRNRCLYARSVLRFHQDKYGMDMDKTLCNFKQQEHICGLCNCYLKKKKIYPQAICNELNIPTVLRELKKFNILECVSFSRRLLFKKVALVPKGCFPKLKRAIRNIPRETNGIVDVLPRSADSNIQIFIKFKQELSFRDVYLEAVSPEAVQLALMYLQQSNPSCHNIRTNFNNILDVLLDLT